MPFEYADSKTELNTNVQISSREHAKCALTFYEFTNRLFMSTYMFDYAQISA